MPDFDAKDNDSGYGYKEWDGLKLDEPLELTAPTDAVVVDNVVGATIVTENKQGASSADEFMGCLFGLVLIMGLVFLMRGCAGCGKENPPLESNYKENPPVAHNDNGLQGFLPGKWQKVEKVKENSEPAVLDFTAKSVEKIHYGLERVGKYIFSDDIITFTDRDGHENVYGLEFLNGGEIALRPERIKSGSESFSDLSGRWRRISLAPNVVIPSKEVGSIADAQRQVERIEQKLAKLESLLETTIIDRDKLGVKLRSVGVNSPADLKNNVRGKRLAENVVTIGTEIESLELQIGDIETDLLKARSLVRRMESQQAGLSDEEMKELTLQLRMAEERTSGAPLLVTPLDIDAAVEKVLKASKK